MLLFAIALLAGWVVGYASGGRTPYIARLRFRWLPVFALAVGLLALSTRTGDRGGYLIAGIGFMLTAAWLVRNALDTTATAPGYLIIAVGWLANFLVIAVNHGMPVSTSALYHAHLMGIPLETQFPGRHVVMTAHTSLSQMGDVFAIGPLHVILSPGDVLIYIGLAVLIARAMQLRPGRESRARATIQQPALVENRAGS